MSQPTLHIAARMRLGSQRCRVCGVPLGADWSGRDVPLKDVPRFKPGARVVMLWDLPYRAIWAEKSYPRSKGEPVLCGAQADGE